MFSSMHEITARMHEALLSKATVRVNRYIHDEYAQCCNTLRDIGCEQVVLMGLAESYRNNGSAPGVDGLDKLYPGTPVSL